MLGQIIPLRWIFTMTTQERADFGKNRCRFKGAYENSNGSLYVLGCENRTVSDVRKHSALMAERYLWKLMFTPKHNFKLTGWA